MIKFCKKCQVDRERDIRGKCKLCTKTKDILYREFNKEKIKKANTQYYSDNSEKEKARRVAWYKANTEKTKATNAAWQSANIEKSKAIGAAYRSLNKDKTRAAIAAWQAVNKDKAAAKQVEWKAANPDLVLIYNQNKRAKRSLAIGKLTKGLRSKLHALQKGKCACCANLLGDSYHMDHIMPLILGGSNTDDNIQLLRSTCNQQKHAKHPIDFMQERGFLI